MAIFPSKNYVIFPCMILVYFKISQRWAVFEKKESSSTFEAFWNFCWTLKGFANTIQQQKLRCGEFVRLNFCLKRKRKFWLELDMRLLYLRRKKHFSIRIDCNTIKIIFEFNFHKGLNFIGRKNTKESNFTRIKFQF